MSGEGYDLTDAQISVLRNIPNTREEIAEELGITRRAVRYRMNKIEEKGGAFTRDENFIWDWAGSEDLSDVIEIAERTEEDGDLKVSDLTKREEYLIQKILPASIEEIADELQITIRVAKTHIEDLQDRGLPLSYDDTNNAWYIKDSNIKRKIGSYHQGTITRKANNWLAQVEDTQIRQARSLEPVVSVQEPTEGNEDILAALSDLHVGQTVVNEMGEEVYSEDEWREAVREFTTKCIEIPERMVAPHIEFDTFHLLLNGDMVTNENIYKGQIEDIGAYLAEQIDISIEELLQLITALADKYDNLNVVCQVGNHGQMRSDGSSKQANADLFLYRELERVINFSDYENVNFQVGKATPYKTFKLRGGKWKVMATHGEVTYEQITGTSASDSQMQNWLNRLRPDIFFIGHFHEYRQAPVMGIPAIRVPSPKPGGIYEWEIGKMESPNAQHKIGYIQGASDNRPITWQAAIDAQDSDVLNY